MSRLQTGAVVVICTALVFIAICAVVEVLTLEVKRRRMAREERASRKPSSPNSRKEGDA
jgi:hypothetical protein